MKRFTRIATSVVLVIALLIPFTGAVQSFAEAEIVASGTCGAEGDNLTWTLDADGVLVISGSGEMKDFIEPNETGYYHIPRPWGDSKLKSVIIEDGVTSIGILAFQSASLKEISIPNSVTTIGSEAFSESKLTSIIIPDSVTTIGESVFEACEDLSEVKLPENLERIPSRMFYECLITSIEIPSSVREIGFWAFAWTPLEHIVFNEGLETIEEEAFWNCWALTDVQLPSSLKNIGIGAFSGVPIESIDLPDNLVSIGSGAFSGTHLNRVIIPSSIEEIESSAFYGCEELQEIVLNDGLTTIGSSAFFGCRQLEGITLPDSITSIGDEAFVDCSNMHEITIPKGVKHIGPYAFGYECKEENNFNNSKMSDFLIHCYANSQGYEYAKYYGIKYDLLDATEEPEPADGNLFMRGLKLLQSILDYVRDLFSFFANLFNGVGR